MYTFFHALTWLNFSTVYAQKHFHSLSLQQKSIYGIYRTYGRVWRAHISLNTKLHTHTHTDIYGVLTFHSVFVAFIGKNNRNGRLWLCLYAVNYGAIELVIHANTDCKSVRCVYSWLPNARVYLSFVDRTVVDPKPRQSHACLIDYVILLSHTMWCGHMLCISIAFQLDFGW